MRTRPPRARGVEEAAAEVDDNGRAERRQLGDRRVLDEPVDAVVARVHLEDHGDVVAGDRPAIVVEARAVGGADIDENGARLRHHLGHAEPAADLHALPATHRHGTAGGEGGEHEEDGGGVVVDDHRRLGPAQPGVELPDGALARAALAGCQIELERLRPGVLVVGQRGAAEVGVQQHARGVDDRGEQRPAQRLRPGRRLGDGAVADRLAGDVDRQRVRQPGQRASESIDRRRARHRRRGYDPRSGRDSSSGRDPSRIPRRSAPRCPVERIAPR